MKYNKNKTKYNEDYGHIIYLDIVNNHEITMEVLHISFSKKKDYSIVKSKLIYVVDALSHNTKNYIFEKVYVKFRHAKKAYKKLKKVLEEMEC